MSDDRFTKTRDAARGKWKGILVHFGIPEAFLKPEHGPCPICKGKDRFRFDDRDGDGTYYCSHCEPGTGMRLLMEYKHWEFGRAAKEVDAIIGNIQVAAAQEKKAEVNKAAIMRRMWRESLAVSPGDPVWRYLESRCGDPSGVLQDIRFHPRLWHSLDKQTHPAMLARMIDPSGPRVVGIHRTYLTPDGRKAAVDPVRKSYGEVLPVRLGGVQERLGVAEGIETAISAGKLFGMPCWSAISANGMEAFEPPPETKTVVICGDNDASYTGQKAAFALAHRLTKQGLAVEIQIPPVTGTDWADVQMEGVA
jgi:putative DNA primase/helicase